MKRLFGGLLVGVALVACTQQQTQAPQPVQPLDTSEQKAPVADPSQPVASGNTPTAADIAAVAGLNARFDPSRNPADDLETAMVEAQRGGKRIVVHVGSEGCEPCAALDGVIAGDADIRRLRDANYVWIKVNASPENDNAGFLAAYPEVTGQPQLFVLDARGELLHSQAAGELDAGSGIDRARVKAFLEQWAPPQS